MYAIDTVVFRKLYNLSYEIYCHDSISYFKRSNSDANVFVITVKISPSQVCVALRSQSCTDLRGPW